MGSTPNLLYEGTQEDWANVTLESSSHVEDIAVYYYSETEPTTEGNYWYYDNNNNIVEW